MRPPSPSRRSRSGSVPRGHVSTKPEGLVLNKLDLCSIKDIAYSNPGVEFLYLRENDFSGFDPYIRLEELKMLDLSLNNITSLLFLWGGGLPHSPEHLLLPSLRHLYLTGNGITSLQGLTSLRMLETVALSSNHITSFEGMDSLPNLRVLSLAHNSIANFKFFPFLPALTTLQLTGNPVAMSDAYRVIAVSLCCHRLTRIDGHAVSNEERSAADTFQGKIAFCITEGFIPTAPTDIEIKAEADAFLLAHQRSSCHGPLLLHHISLALEDDSPYTSAAPLEGVPILLTACLQDTTRGTIFHSPCFSPVAFKVTGAARTVLVVGSFNGWGEGIPLTRFEEGDEVQHRTTLYLPPGQYEYRYVIDGEEQVTSHRKTMSRFGKGLCNCCTVLNSQHYDEEERDTILHIRWLRSNEHNCFDLIANQSGLAYVPTTDDIGRCLRCEILIYLDGVFNSLFFDITFPVEPGFPSCTKAAIVGEAVEGSTLVVEYEYHGGTEHPQSAVHWYRARGKEEEEVTALAHKNNTQYVLTEKDVGCRIRAKIVPLRDDWVTGPPVECTTSVVEAAPPVASAVQIVGRGVVGEQLTVQYDYYCGEAEGRTAFVWRRNGYPVSKSVSPSFMVRDEDAGATLQVEVVPVTVDGKEGTGEVAEIRIAAHSA